MNNSPKKGLARPVSWLFVGFMVLTGCASVGPNYYPPKTSVSSEWNTQLTGGLNAQEMNPQTLASWWKTLDDPALLRLIERAVSGNLDVKKARAKIREARARRGIAKADRFPTFDASGSVVRSRNSEETGSGNTGSLYEAGIDAAWELDVFGGVRRSVEAAEADLGATQEGLRDTLVSLLAEVALNYIEVRTYQTRLTIAEANFASQSETYQLTLWRFEAGVGDELAVEQARYNLENTRSQIPTLRTGAVQAINSIALLLGEQPGTVQKELEQYTPIPVIPAEVAVGAPADVLRRRPDIRKAGRELAAQTARIGVAAAELYPKFKLSGSIGLEAFSFGNLLSWGSRTFNGGSGISWRIFDAGAIRQDIEVQSALQEQYLIAYEASVLGALKEVENALTAFAQEQKRRQSLAETARAAEGAVELAEYKYQAGLADFTNVLDAQRSLLSFQDQLAQSEGTVTSNLVRLYKALGGGWTSLGPEETKQLFTGSEKK